MAEQQIVTIVIAYGPKGQCEVELWIGGKGYPTGIKGPTVPACMKLLVDRLAGTAP